MKKLKSNAGFTLIELIISMAVFSSLLLIVTVGFLNVIRSYQAGLAARNAQQNARFAMEQIAREAREASDAQIYHVTVSPAVDNLCLTTASGTVEYFVSAQRLFRASIDPTQTCPSGQLNPTALTSAEVAVVQFKVSPYQNTTVATNPKSLRFDLGVSSTTDVTRLNATQTACDPSQSGYNFCSVMNLRSSVTLRGTP